MIVQVPPRHTPTILGLRPARGMPTAESFARLLGERCPPVLVSERLGVIRISPHVSFFFSFNPS